MFRTKSFQVKLVDDNKPTANGPTSITRPLTQEERRAIYADRIAAMSVGARSLATPVCKVIATYMAADTIRRVAIALASK